MAARRLALWFLNRVARKERDHEAMISALQGGFLGFGANVSRQLGQSGCEPPVGRRSQPGRQGHAELHYRDSQTDEVRDSYSPPCKGGVDAASIKSCEATESAADGVVAHARRDSRATTPSAPFLGWGHFLDGAATPSQGGECDRTTPSQNESREGHAM
jgi:hypothetical protein